MTSGPEIPTTQTATGQFTRGRYEGEGLGQILSWTCPACGVLQTQPFGTPCADCGAGRGPYKVTEAARPVGQPVDPANPVPPGLGLREFAAEGSGARRSPLTDPPQADDALFADWFAGVYVPGSSTDRTELTTAVRWLAQAFAAGRAAERRLQQARPTALTAEFGPLSGLQPPMVGGGATAPPLPFNPEGAIARTLAAALAPFIDQVLIDAEAEIAAGEYCTLDQAREVLSQLRAAGANAYHA